MPNPTCPEPGCGMKMIFPLIPVGDLRVCPRNDDAHALCAKLAESEAKVAALEAKLCRMVDLAGEADDTMREGNFHGAQAILQIILIEARKKGAQHE